MSKKEFLYKIYKCLKGFATFSEIKEEYNYLEQLYNCPQLEMVENIKNWLRWNISEADNEFIIWERLEREGL